MTLKQAQDLVSQVLMVSVTVDPTEEAQETLDLCREHWARVNEALEQKDLVGISQAAQGLLDGLSLVWRDAGDTEK